MDDLAAFIEARLADDEAWARAASEPYKYADGSPTAPAEGVHWQWGAGENWKHVEPDLAKDIIGGYGENVQLLTIETWPSQHGKWQMQRSYSDHMCEVNSAAAGHIARHDPARVLREVTAKRAMVARYEDCLARMEDPEYSAMAANIERLEYEEWVLPAMAAAWSDHPGYRAEWAPAL